MGNERLPNGFTLHEGEWIYLPRRTRWKLACCDCNLVHDVERRIEGGRLYVRLYRDEKETASLRKAMKWRKR